MILFFQYPKKIYLYHLLYFPIPFYTHLRVEIGPSRGRDRGMKKAVVRRGG
jgi:hypothetical protein